MRGQAQPQNLALLEDRVLVSQGKEQIYGSQLRQNQSSGKYEFYPIEDEPKVNIRRASVGLNSLEEYAKLFDIIYHLPQVKN